MTEEQTGHGATQSQSMARGVAAGLLERDDDSESDLISLVDIVITGIETDWQHFRVRKYDPDADGSADHPWAIIERLSSAGMPRTHVALDAVTMRAAVELYLVDRLEHGMSLDEACHMVDGSYTDAVVADSILQFALYGEEVFG